MNFIITSIVTGIFLNPVCITHWRVRGPDPALKFFQTHPNIFHFLFFVKKFIDLFLFLLCVDFHKNTILFAAELKIHDCCTRGRSKNT